MPRPVPRQPASARRATLPLFFVTRYDPTTALAVDCVAVEALSKQEAATQVLRCQVATEGAGPGKALARVMGLGDPPKEWHYFRKA